MARAGRVVAGIDIGNSTTEAVLLEKLDGETYGRRHDRHHRRQGHPR